MSTSKAHAKAGRIARAAAADDLASVFAAVARYFGLLSEPTRLRILHAICETDLSVGEIVAVTGASQTNASRHLGRLHQAGVISRERVGNRVHYRVTDSVATEICRTVCMQIAARIEAGGSLRRNLLGFAAAHPAPKSRVAASVSGGKRT